MEDNCRPQSKAENEYKDGNVSVFRENLEKERHRLSEWLEEQGRQVAKPTLDELKQLIISYRAKVRILEKKIKK